MPINDEIPLLLIDGDIVAYRASSSVQKDIDWGEGLFTCHAYLEDAIDQFKAILEGILTEFYEHTLDDTYLKESAEDNMLFFFSDKDNFRKHYLHDYKSNRENTRKPTCYNALVEWIRDNYKYIEPIKYLEADDLIGIYTTTHEDSVIVSMDKDFKTIPGKFFDFGRGEFKTISKDEADYWHMYQTLVGDVTDGYKGCPSFGPVKATKLLSSVPRDKYWETVVNAYVKQGLTEDDAILQATMARILRKEDYERWMTDNKDCEIPPLWSPIKEYPHE